MAVQSSMLSLVISAEKVSFLRLYSCFFSLLFVVTVAWKIKVRYANYVMSQVSGSAFPAAFPGVVRLLRLVAVYWCGGVSQFVLVTVDIIGGGLSSVFESNITHAWGCIRTSSALEIGRFRGLLKYTLLTMIIFLNLRVINFKLTLQPHHQYIT